MKKFVLIPDSFKGTMPSSEICAVMAEEIKKYYPDAEVVSIPVADGGEGSVDAFLAAVGGRKVTVTVKGPYMEDMTGFYGVLDDGTAVVEMAACAGLPLVSGRKHPDKTTTYGVGQLIAHAALNGCRKIIVGLGGSCTNDAGTGAASAAGVKFFDKNGKPFLPTGGTLGDIAKIDTSGLLPEIKKAHITAMCDIDNPLYGENGAAYVFAPQKGADEKMVETLDSGLRKLAETVKKELGIDIDGIPGAGAAGGMGGGMAAFFGSGLQKGIETVLDTVNFDTIAKDADIVFTGEGRLDSQSLRGKVVIGAARRAKKLGVPLIAVVGDTSGDIEPAYANGVSSIFCINRPAKSFEEVLKNSKTNLRFAMDSILRLMHSMKM